MLRAREEDEREAFARPVPGRDVAPRLGLLRRDRGEELEGAVRRVEDAAPLPAEEERPRAAREKRRARLPLRLADEREPGPVSRLEVEVVGSRGAAARPVVDRERARQGGGEVEESRELAVDALGRVVAMDDGQVPPDDRERVAEEDVVVSPRQAALLGREVPRAEEAGAFGDRGRVDLRRRRGDAVRDVAEKRLAPVGDDGPRLRPREPGQPRREERPLRLLRAEELRDARGEAVVQGRPPRSACRAAISCVRSQSL